MSVLTQTNLTNGDKNEKQLKFSPNTDSNSEHNSDSSIVLIDASQNMQQFQIDTPKVSNNNNTHAIVTDSSPTNLTASITENKDYAATFIDIDSVRGCIKQKYLKFNIINPMQSYLYVVIEQEKNDRHYQSKYKLKLGKIIQSLRDADDKVAIVKYAEHIVKNKEDFVSLPEDSLTHITQLPTALTKTQFFSPWQA